MKLPGRHCHQGEHSLLLLSTHNLTQTLQYTRLIDELIECCLCLCKCKVDKVMLPYGKDVLISRRHCVLLLSSPQHSTAQHSTAQHSTAQHCWDACAETVACRERADKEAFYEGQGKTGGAFMRMALTTLALLNKLSAHPVIKGSFLQPPLVGSAAYNCLHFLELLVRTQCMFSSTNMMTIDSLHLCCCSPPVLVSLAACTLQM